MTRTTSMIMRYSLWLPIVGSAFVALLWLMLCFAMGFSAWMQETNAGGRFLQAALIFYPFAVYIAYRLSERRPAILPYVFGVSWIVGIGALAWVEAWRLLL